MQHSSNIETNKKYAFTLAEVFLPRFASSRKVAFTLAEVLITLGIIGVVAAMTMPSIIQNVQKHILKNQFKKVYSTFSQGVFQAQSQLDMPVGCSYWLDGYKCNLVCKKYNSYNTCTAWTCEDGSPEPQDYNGLRDDCAVFDEELFTRVFKVVKFCENNALAKGCLTSEYRGVDKINAELNPGTSYDPDSGMSDMRIKKLFPSWVLADGTVIIKYGVYNSASAAPMYTVDINGHKKPNKWGYDIFTFRLFGNNDGIKKINGYNYATEKGGTSSTQMIQEMNK